MLKRILGVISLISIFATAADAQDRPPIAILKICKIGNGIQPQTPFQFHLSNGATVTVPSGLPPSGNCWIAGGFAPSSNVTVTEIAPGYTVTNITLAGGGTLSANPPNPTATVSNMGAGVSVLTYTNEKARLGYLEICKINEGATSAMFAFNTPGYGSASIASGSCTPPMQGPAGNVNITETSPGYSWVACVYYLNGLSHPCTAGSTVTVPVVPGGVQGETMVFAINRKSETGQGAPPAQRSSEDVLGPILNPK